MTRMALGAVALVGGLLVTGCASDPTCDDVDSLTEQLADTDVDDPDYNTIVNDLAQAQADCNT